MTGTDLEILRPGQRCPPWGRLQDYEDALALMDALVARPAEAPDVLISAQHPPCITVGRRGDAGAIHGTRWPRPDGSELAVAVHRVARGGSVTWHAPGQLVIYPVVQLARMAGPLGQGPLGDLPRFVRTLEAAMQACCARFGLSTVVRPGFSGLWTHEGRKIASIGVGARRGWTFHGLALNVCPDLSGFALITPCGLEGVRMTSMEAELVRRAAPVPTLEEVEADLLARLAATLRRARPEDNAGHEEEAG